VYSIDGIHHDFFLAAGKSGLVSVFDAHGLGLSPSSAADDGSTEHQEPSLSAKVHSRWISEIQLLAPAEEGGPHRLLSAADDKSLVLSSVTTSRGADGALNATVVPRARLECV
jgi:hypothetical protein